MFNIREILRELYEYFWFLNNINVRGKGHRKMEDCKYKLRAGVGGSTIYAGECALSLQCVLGRGDFSI